MTPLAVLEELNSAFTPDTVIEIKVKGFSLKANERIQEVYDIDNPIQLLFLAIPEKF